MTDKRETVGIVELPRSMYPITMEMFSERTGEKVHHIHVAEPGVATCPDLVTEHGPIATRLSFGDGMVLTVNAANEVLANDTYE